jgi:hypothetical protein
MASLSKAKRGRTREWVNQTEWSKEQGEGIRAKARMDEHT